MIRVGVLRGGTSPEYEQSLKTGAYILKNLPRDAYVPVDLFIDRDGLWHMGGVQVSTDTLKHRVDVIWNALHGYYGEDGKVQQLLEGIGIPYIGSGPVPSAQTANRKLLKEKVSQLGIKTLRDVIVEDWGGAEPHVAAQHVVGEVFKKFSPPWNVFPMHGTHAGTSVRCATRDELGALLTKMCELNVPVLIEEVIFGNNVHVVAMDTYRGKKGYTLMPSARLTTDESKKLQEVAAKIHAEFGLRHVSCTHAIITPRGHIYVCKMETVPQLHEDSAVHKGLEAVGSSFKKFAKHLIDAVVGRR